VPASDIGAACLAPLLAVAFCHCKPDGDKEFLTYIIISMTKARPLHPMVDAFLLHSIIFLSVEQ
jgi:hypothetical protein